MHHWRQSAAETWISGRYSARCPRASVGSAAQDRHLLRTFFHAQASEFAKNNFHRRAQGKTIAVGAVGGARTCIARVLLKQFNINPDREINFLSVAAAQACIALMSHSAGVDLLVHEVTAAARTAAQSPEQLKRIRQQSQYTEQAAEVFRRVQPQLAVYNHLLLFGGARAEICSRRLVRPIRAGDCR